MTSYVKTEEEIQRIRRSAKILAAVLRRLTAVSAPGVTLIELDTMARGLIETAGGKPAFLNYRPYGASKGFPFTLCASVNNVIVHGLPSGYALKSGDLLKLDLGVDWEGGISDSAITIPIGRVDSEGLRLTKVTKLALREGIRAAKDGNKIGDIGFAIERAASAAGFKVAEGLTGHGVGNELHEEPTIYNYGKPHTGVPLKNGMVIAIEPMINIGSAAIKQLKDDSYVTADGSLSAHFEHTVLITRTGGEVLSA
ncbi:MAG: type I methionyl aminopeptidase [Patescibacteria group bacterium]|nr:type I methionyl aminopeptidase [Patescibacteria group bacterium]MCL5224015.1 type I methionyl aminopeptidase [Patescibacteria group bacterium]